MDVLITHLNHKGEGVARHEDGQTITVPYTLEGETVAIDIVSQNKYGYSAKKVKILEASAHRQTAPCPHFEVCGGCALQHLDDISYKDFKKNLIANALTKNGFEDVQIEELLILPEKVRRRCKLVTTKHKNKTSLGFRQKHSHDIARIQTCAVIHPQLEVLIKPLENMCHKLLNNKQQADIYLSTTEGLVDMFIDLGKVEKFLSYEEREGFADFAKQNNITKLTLKTKTLEDLLYMKEEPFVRFVSVPVHVGSRHFLQASQNADIALQDFILGHLKGEKIKKVADLFCGHGTFSFIFPENIQVHGYEADKDALSHMNKAALKYKPSVQGRHLNLYDEPLKTKALNEYDALILDPPRDGALKQCEEIAQSKMKRVVYISCNPLTFARDAKVLTHSGYTLQSVRPVDQFLWSTHIEVIGFFEK